MINIDVINGIRGSVKLIHTVNAKLKRPRGQREYYMQWYIILRTQRCDYAHISQSLFD